MRPKGKLFALFAIFAAIGLVTATGAFTTVEAQRTVAVDVAGDSSALLGLEPNSTSPNDQYATTENNQIVIDFSSSALGTNATGVNVNATTQADHVINVTNNADRDITLSVQSTNNNPNANVTLYEGTDPVNNEINSTSSITLTSGEQTTVGVFVNTTGSGSTTNFNETLTFIAEGQ